MGIIPTLRTSVGRLTYVACVLVSLHIAIAIISHRFHYSAALAELPIIIFVGLFLLSPTQFPWYATWFIPLLALSPGFSSLLLLTALLPLYYLRFHFMDIGQVEIFDYGVVWVEYVPVWGMLLWETLKHKRDRSNPLEKTDVEVQ